MCVISTVFQIKAIKRPTTKINANVLDISVFQHYCRKCRQCVKHYGFFFVLLFSVFAVLIVYDFHTKRAQIFANCNKRHKRETKQKTYSRQSLFHYTRQILIVCDSIAVFLSRFIKCVYSKVC